ncbi:Crp/Fnr family transcriptional regulator [Dyadobacter alkalitolerans]|uniref:Crp/Fnr family transcriptional regulator n=1 Tax=Dyadobacter alkalitolerans TaxID=492736 RepID=UPI000415D986|nr:Crp/Fnr family transcriptional regulator [Dyadobacter alkalitolerans]
MYEAFFEYLKKYSADPLSDQEKILLKQELIPSKLRKRQFLLQAGDLSKSYAFIITGSMRMFKVDDKGAEHMVRLGVEGWWMGDRESAAMGTPSRYYIDAWDNTEVLLINRESINELIKTVPAFCEMMRLLDERNIIANNRRLTSSISDSVEKRYDEFVSLYPELLNRFPQHIIASYLGVNKDTLSRVRRQRAQK